MGTDFDCDFTHAQKAAHALACEGAVEGGTILTVCSPGSSQVEHGLQDCEHDARHGFLDQLEPLSCAYCVGVSFCHFRAMSAAAETIIESLLVLMNSGVGDVFQ